MGKVTVSQGDCIASMAHENGFFWETIWNHGENAALKAKRGDPNQLVAGDEVFVPDKDLKQESCATEQRHKFKIKGATNKFRVQLKALDEPRANEDYVLEIDGKLRKGKTDSSGVIEEIIPGNARGGRIILSGGKEEIPIRLGNLDPIDTLSGVQQRLNNLGFDCGGEDGEMNDQTKAAIELFQTKHKVPVTGEADGPTKAKLKELHA